MHTQLNSRAYIQEIQQETEVVGKEDHHVFISHSITVAILWFMRVKRKPIVIYNIIAM